MTYKDPILDDTDGGPAINASMSGELLVFPSKL